VLDGILDGKNLGGEWGSRFEGWNVLARKEDGTDGVTLEIGGQEVTLPCRTYVIEAFFLIPLEYEVDGRKFRTEEHLAELGICRFHIPCPPHNPSGKPTSVAFFARDLPVFGAKVHQVTDFTSLHETFSIADVHAIEGEMAEMFRKQVEDVLEDFRGRIEGLPAYMAILKAVLTRRVDTKSLNELTDGILVEDEAKVAVPVTKTPTLAREDQ